MKRFSCVPASRSRVSTTSGATGRGSGTTGCSPRGRRASRRLSGIDKRHNGASLLRGGEFFCTEDELTESFRSEISQTPRIGLAAGRGDEIPWRFVVPGHPYASRRS